MTELRAKARKSGVYLRVLKHPGAPRRRRHAVAGLSQHMKGPLVYGISPDPVATAKVLNEFAQSKREARHPRRRRTERRDFRQGSHRARVAAVARGAAREALGTMQAPIVKLVRTLNEVRRALCAPSPRSATRAAAS